VGRTRDLGAQGLAAVGHAAQPEDPELAAGVIDRVGRERVSQLPPMRARNTRSATTRRSSAGWGAPRRIAKRLITDGKLIR